MTGGPAAPSGGNGSWEELTFTTARVLIVDDVESNVVLLQRIVRSMGITDIECTSVATEAVALARRFGPDLVLLDLHMPGLDGIGVLRGLRGDLAPNEFVPVVMLTADGSDASKQRALGAGANDFLTKPFDHAEVVLRVQNLLRTRQLHVRVQAQNNRLRALVDRQTDRERRLQKAAEIKITRIRRAIDDGIVRMAYQPIVELATARAVGHEALARFDHPSGEGPAVWFAEAAEVGLARDLELHAVGIALAGAPPDGFVSINVSPRTAMSEPLLAAVAAHGGARVVVEITEHNQVDDYPAVKQAFARLRHLGARIAMDDLGAGYSGLQHILQLRPDVVKLDTALIRGIDADLAKRALVTSFVQFAREIGTTLIAEGIESADELSTLRSLGVVLGQGFLLGRPSFGPARLHTVVGTDGATSR
jgi:EAL domain-containing protein (putative c-di-GMP-specific phosphodiesterase class I)/FixJ family two-component response regulator